MNRDRLALLLDVLDKVPPERFDIRHWIQNPTSLRNGGQPTCGTVACVGGGLALDPRARKQGLRIARDGMPLFDGYMGFYHAYPVVAHRS